MNQIIFIYSFTGEFQGNAVYDYPHPQVGDRHRCLLFLAQTDEETQHDSALAECAKYGFIQVAISRCGQLQTEVLETDEYRGFAQLYEEAMNKGSSLLYYPNTLPN